MAKGNGEQARFIAGLLTGPVTDKCILWPFGRNNMGYAVTYHERKSRSAARVVLKLSVGLPQGRMDAAHSCGNGHLGCVNPAHLRWATRAENCRDMRGHGTAPVGSRNGMAKLTEEQVLAIREMRKHAKLTEIAAKFNVSASRVSAIALGNAWGSV